MKRCVWVNGFLFYVLVVFSINSMESKKDEQSRESYTFTILEYDAARCSFCRVNENYTHNKNVLFFPGHENIFFKDCAYDGAQEFTYLSAIKNLYSEIYPESNYPVGGLCFTEHKFFSSPFRSLSFFFRGCHPLCELASGIKCHRVERTRERIDLVIMISIGELLELRQKIIVPRS